MDPPSKLLFPARSPSLPLEVSIEYPTPTSCSSTIPPSSLTSSRASSPGMDPMISQLGTSANPHKNAFGTGDHPVWVPTMNSENTVSSSAPTSYLDSSKSTTTSSSPRLTDAFLDHPGWAELTSSPDPPDLPLLFTSTSVAPRTDDGWMTPPYFTGALFSPSTPPVLYVSPRQLHLPPPPPPFILSSATAAAVVVEFPAASESRSTSVPVAPAQFQAVYAAAATDSFSAAATAVMTTREATASPSCCSTPSWVASADSNTHWVDDCSSTMSCTRDFAQQHLFDSPRRSSSPPGTPYITNLPTGTACDEVEMPVDLPPPPPPPPPIPLPLTSISTSTGSSRGRFTRRESPAYGERPAARWRTNSPVVLAAGSAGSKPRAASARAAAREARRNVAAAAAAAQSCRCCCGSFGGWQW
ncbi:hypothetical protein BC828DRAFT_166998 [Blastocladiella britannica]|nr:hypothetical protein BC828DRAFT_166998 [Blastocladiella britannica]